MAPTLLPLFVTLSGRPVLVVGGGAVAASKIATLVSTGAAITVVAPTIVESIVQAGVRTEQRAFRETDLEGVWFVVAAATPGVNAEVARAAEVRRVFVNAVDDPPNATAYLGGVVRRSDATIAISTGGRAPALAGLLREGLDAILPADEVVAGWLAQGDALKRQWRSAGVPMADRRPQLAEAIATRYCGTLACCRTARDRR